MLGIMEKNKNEKQNNEQTATKKNESFFTNQYTNISKGIALLLLLFHYLGLNPELHLFSTSGIANVIAEQCKVCVAIFLILSGYGLNASFNKKMKEKSYCFGIIKFSLKNLLKLMFNFWIIFGIFICFGHFTGIRQINSVYGSESLVKNLFIDFLGLADLFKTPTYNATWWFMSLIIILYIIFPILKTFLKKTPLVFILIAFCISKFGLFRFYTTLNIYLFAFCLGMFVSEFFIFDKIKNMHATKIQEMFSAIIVLFIGLYTRYKLGGEFDTFAAFSIIFFGNSIVANLGNIIRSVFRFLGKHSSNIFMMHTFIYKYFFNRIFCKFKILVCNVCSFGNINFDYFSYY